MELIPLCTAFLPVGLKLLDYFVKGTSTSDFQSKLERAESMLREMEPLVRKMKKAERASELGEFGRLIQRAEEGKKLVLQIRRSGGNQKKYGNQVEEWMQSFRDSLLFTMLQLHLNTATGEEKIRQHLLPKHQSPQIIHVHLHSPDLQQLSISLMKDQNYSNTIQKFIDCVSMFGGLEPLLQKRGCILQAAAPSHTIAPPPPYLNAPAPRRPIAPLGHPSNARPSLHPVTSLAHHPSVRPPPRSVAPPMHHPNYRPPPRPFAPSMHHPNFCPPPRPFAPRAHHVNVCLPAHHPNARPPPRPITYPPSRPIAPLTPRPNAHPPHRPWRTNAPPSRPNTPSR